MKGASQVEFLAVLLILIISLAIGWPYLTRSDHASAEAKAIGTLKVIHEAQRDFYGGRQYYGTESQLREFGVLTGVDLRQTDAQRAVGLESKLSYSIDISVGGGRTRWCAAAIPTPNGRTIAIDDTGAIQTDRMCVDGEVR